MSRRAIVCCLIVAASSLAESSQAGDRKLEIVLTNMTPDARSSEASKTCVRALEEILRADYANVQRIGETALRKQVGKTAGEPFFDWPSAALLPVKGRAGTDVRYIDTLILVDCQPEAKQLDVLVHPPDGAVVRIGVRSVPLDKDTVRWVAEAALRRAWSGFSP